MDGLLRKMYSFVSGVVLCCTLLVALLYELKDFDSYYL